MQSGGPGTRQDGERWQVGIVGSGSRVGQLSKVFARRMATAACHGHHASVPAGKSSGGQHTTLPPLKSSSGVQHGRLPPLRSAPQARLRWFVCWRQSVAR